MGGGRHQPRRVVRSRIAVAKVPAREDSLETPRDGDTPTVNAMLQLYKLDTPRCSKSLSAHRGSHCAQCPACLVGFYSTPQSFDTVVSELVGQAPVTARARPQGFPAGLQNLANTCYINAVLQCLMRLTLLLRDVFTASAAELAELEPCFVVDVFCRLLLTRFQAVNPGPMIRALHIDASTQQDAQEFLTLFLSMLSDRCQRLNDSIKRVVTGTILYSRRCSMCDSVVHKTQFFVFLSVPVLKNQPVEECITAYKAPEVVQGSCEQCGARDVPLTTTLTLKRPPRYLIIHFMRFQYDAVSQRRKKLGDEIQLLPVLSGDCVSCDAAGQTYKLTALICHRGPSPDTGHYVAYVKNNHNDQWFLCDDDRVSTCADGTVVQCAAVRKTVYMAVYEMTCDEPEDAPLSVHDEVRDRIRAEEEETERMALDYTLLREQRTQELAEWERLCVGIFPKDNASLTASRRTDLDVMTCYFISDEWLRLLVSAKKFNDLAPPQRVISNQSLICPHGDRVNPMSTYRIVPSDIWHKLNERFGCDVELPVLAALCPDCYTEALQRRKALRNATDAWLHIRKALDRAVAGERDADDEYVIVSETALDAIRCQETPPSEAAAAGVCLTANLTCEHHGVSPTAVRRALPTQLVAQLREYGYDTGQRIPDTSEICSVCHQNAVAATAAAHTMKCRKFQCKSLSIYKHDNNRGVFGRDLVKYTRNHRRKQLEEQRVAVPNTPPIVAAASPPPTDADAIDAPVDESTPLPPRVVDHFVLPFWWVELFNAWMDDATHVAVNPPPSGVTCDEFKCAHGLSALTVDDLRPANRRSAPVGIVVKADEIESLVKQFEIDPDTLVRLREVDTERMMVPAPCLACIDARRQEEERQRHEFTDGTIRIEGRLRKSKRQRVNVQLELQHLHHQAALTMILEQISAALLGQYDLRVPPSCLHLYRDKTEILVTSNASLGQSGLVDGDTLRIDVDEAAVEDDGEWESVPDKLLHPSAPLTDFSGTALAGAGTRSAARQCDVGKECAVCTFINHNARTLCEMCESPLS